MKVDNHTEKCSSSTSTSTDRLPSLNKDGLHSLNIDGLHSLNSFIIAKAKIAILMWRIKRLEVPSTSQVGHVNQLETPICFSCRTSNHI